MGEMEQIAVRAENVALRYSVRTEDRRTLKRAFLGFFKKRYQKEVFWALDAVNFTIPCGETWGILGLNGSGKSTLLKLMTGILRPDRGSMTVSGRVSALLELGAGFQPDLTGRENIFLNGSLLGLTHRVVRERMQAIIDFSGIADFIDTPVKHYSSGMYMRLGFSIAVNVDPDILLIDEIFAVGDLNFQEKCMQRIQQFKAENKTIILVSHDMQAIRSLCDNAMWLERGQVMKTGRTDEVIDFYKNHVLQQQDVIQQMNIPADEQHRWGTGHVRITDVTLHNAAGDATRNFRSGDTIECRIQFRAEGPVEHPVFGIAIHRHDGIHVCGPNSHQNRYETGSVNGCGTVVYTIPAIPLLPGNYLLSAVVYDQHCAIPYDHMDRMFPFAIVEGSSAEIYGIIALNGQWNIKKRTASDDN